MKIFVAGAAGAVGLPLELDYRLIGELWAFTDNRIAARFTSEYHDIRDAWLRASGGEHWEFDLDGSIRRRYCSVN